MASEELSPSVGLPEGGPGATQETLDRQEMIASFVEIFMGENRWGRALQGASCSAMVLADRAFPRSLGAAPADTVRGHTRLTRLLSKPKFIRFACRPGPVDARRNTPS